MKKTALLDILADVNFPIGKIVIHPNDGSDLDLFQLSYPVKLFCNLTIEEFKETASPRCTHEYFEGELLLSNRCRSNTIELSMKLNNQLKNPDKALLVYEDGRLLLLTK